METKTPVKVHFVTDIKDGKRKEHVAFHANGQYYIKGQAAYLSFKEEQEVGTIHTIIKITTEEVLILRSGAVKMRQLFRKKEQTQGSYESSLGTFLMQAKTNNIEHDWSEKSGKGRLFLTYLLNLQGESAGRYKITIHFKEEQK